MLKKQSCLCWLSLVGLFVFSPAFSSSLTGETNFEVIKTGNYKSGELIVQYRKDLDRSRIEMRAFYQRNQVVGVTNLGESMADFQLLKFRPDQDLERTMALLLADPMVETVEFNHIIKTPRVLKSQKDLNHSPNFLSGISQGLLFRTEEGLAPMDPAVQPAPVDPSPPVADPLLDDAYGISKIGAPTAWETSKGNRKVIVAVIDSGIDYNHPDLAGNMWRNPNPTLGDKVGYDFVNNDNMPFDDDMHGTHCAGIIGAVGFNGIGISGVAPRVSVMAVKFLDGSGGGSIASAIRAIDYAVSKGAKILSNSWGANSSDGFPSLSTAIVRAMQKDVLFVVAAGNETTNNDDVDGSYPAKYTHDNIISVAATNNLDRMAYFSNFGIKTVHLAAPGVDIYSTIPNNSYEVLDGTSMAAPYVSGAAALVWAAHPNYTYKQVKAALLRSVDKIPALMNRTVTGGRLNVAQAISLIQ